MSGRSTTTEKHILDLFKNQNRPFSVQVVADFLAQYGIKKAQVQKTLDYLADNQKITVKEFGKTRIFWPNQSFDDVLSKEDLEIKKKELTDLKAFAQKQVEELNQLQRGIQSALKASLTLEQIETEIELLSSKKDTLFQKLVTLRESSVLVSPEERSKAEKSLEINMRHWKKWKTAFKEIWGALSENLDRKTSELFEEIGVDIDEEDGETFEGLNRLTGIKRRRVK